MFMLALFAGCAGTDWAALARGARVALGLATAALDAYEATRPPAAASGAEAMAPAPAAVAPARTAVAEARAAVAGGEYCGAASELARAFARMELVPTPAARRAASELADAAVALRAHCGR